MHAADHTSLLAVYSLPIITSGDRYSLVCIFPVKCLWVQHAFPKSTIFIFKLFVSGNTMSFFHIKLYSSGISM